MHSVDNNSNSNSINSNKSTELTRRYDVKWASSYDVSSSRPKCMRLWYRRRSECALWRRLYDAMTSSGLLMLLLAITVTRAADRQAAGVSSVDMRNTHAPRSQRRDGQQQQQQGREHRDRPSSTSPTVSQVEDDQFLQTVEPMHNVTVSPGERAVLKCRVDNLGTRTVTWRRHSESHPLTIGLFPFAPDPRLSVDFNQRTNEWSLIIQDVRPSDGGLYHCQVTSKDEHDSSFEVRLKVKTVYVTGTDYVELGDSIRLACNATGVSTPPGDLDWYRDGIVVQSDPREGVLVTKKVESRVLVVVLFIHPSRQMHAGNYVCRAANDEDSASITVHVINDFLMNRRFDIRGVSAERIMGEHGNDARSTARRRLVVNVLLLYSLVAVTYLTSSASVIDV